MSGRRRAVLTSLAELVGFGLITDGIWRISPIAGLIAAGICLVLIGVLAA